MPPGPPKLPTETKKMRGTFRPNRDGPVDHEMDNLPTVEIECPEDLEGVARQLWEHLVPQLAKVKIVRQVDVPIAAGMCRWFGIWKELDKALKTWKNKEEYDAMDNQRLNALIQRQASDAWKNFSTAAGKLGLSPADRARIRSGMDGGGGTGKDNSDPLSFFGISSN